MGPDSELCTKAARRQAISHEVVEGLQESALVCRKLLRSDLRESAAAAGAAASVLRALASADHHLDRTRRLDADLPTEIIDHRSDGDLLEEVRTALRDPALRAVVATKAMRLDLLPTDPDDEEDES